MVSSGFDRPVIASMAAERQTRPRSLVFLSCGIFVACVVAGMLVTQKEDDAISFVSTSSLPEGTTELLLSPAAQKKLKEAVEAAGKAPSSGERAKIQHLLMPISNHLAVRYLYTEVAERARANPTKPGHQAMEEVLASQKEMNMIEARVKNKLLNPHSGHWAEEVYAKIPHRFIKLLPALTTESAHTATTHAFAHLRRQMLQAEKNPDYMRHLSPSDPRMR